MIFSIAGHEYKSLSIIKFNYSAEILDGAGTGRTQAIGWPMFREPQGVIKNVEMELGLLESSNNDFIRLISVLDNFGIKDFETVSFITPSGIITQQMYSSSYNIDMNRLTKDNVSYWGSLRIKFIAKKAIIT